MTNLWNDPKGGIYYGRSQVLDFRLFQYTASRCGIPSVELTEELGIYKDERVFQINADPFSIQSSDIVEQSQISKFLEFETRYGTREVPFEDTDTLHYVVVIRLGIPGRLCEPTGHHLMIRNGVLQIKEIQGRKMMTLRFSLNLTVLSKYMLCISGPTSLVVNSFVSKEDSGGYIHINRKYPESFLPPFKNVFITLEEIRNINEQHMLSHHQLFTLNSELHVYISRLVLDERYTVLRTISFLDFMSLPEPVTGPIMQCRSRTSTAYSRNLDIWRSLEDVDYLQTAYKSNFKILER